MKKILSLCLAALLLISATPLVFAETTTDETTIPVAADITTTIEAEDYLSNYVHSTKGATSFDVSKVKTATYNEEEITYLKVDWLASGTLTQTFTVNVEAAGMYEVELVAAKGEYRSFPALAVDDQTFGTNSRYTKATTESITDYFNTTDAYRKIWLVRLSAGTHTLTLTYTDRAAESSIAFITDYVKFTPAGKEPVIIADEGATIQLEDYKDHAALEGNVGMGVTTSSHTTALSFNGQAYNGAVVTVPINIAKAGCYNVQAVFSNGVDKVWMSGAYLRKQDGTEILSNKDLKYFKEDVSNNKTYFDTSFHAHKFGNDYVYFDAGVQTLTIHVKLREQNNLAFRGDYISINPVVFPVAEVSSSGATTIELEDYPAWTYTSGEKTGMKLFTPSEVVFNDKYITFLSNGWIVYDTLTQAVELSVETAGEYELNAVIGESEFLSKLTFSLDGEALSAVSTTAIDTKEEYYFGSKDFPAVRKTYLTYLSAGKHTLTLTHGAPTNTSFKRLAFAVDHVQIKPATDGYTAQYLGEGFTRLNLSDTAFTANTPRDFTVEISENGSYAIFLQKEETENTDFTAVFKNDSMSVSLCEAASMKDSYAYPYVRVANESIYLPRGTWTLSLSSLTDITVPYIDIRSTTIPVSGAKQAIYPSDFDTVALSENINSQLSDTAQAKISGYSYYANYASKSLTKPFTYARGISLNSADTATYKLLISDADSYKIKVNGFFRNLNAVSAGTTATLAVATDGSEPACATYTYPADTAALTESAFSAEYDVALKTGVHTLSVTPDATADAYITSVTIENYNPDKENVVVLAKDEIVNFMTNARATYKTSAYANYKTSVVNSYIVGSSAKSDIPKPVTLSWDAIEGAESYTIYVSKTQDFSDDVLKIENITETSYDMYNLYVDTVYYWKAASGESETETKSFYTDKTARYIYADGMRNVRDLGGWNGLNQGLAYRGSKMDVDDSFTDVYMTELGKKVLLEDLGIKTDLDFRPTELTESPLGSDVTFINDYQNLYYMSFATPAFGALLKTFANIDNYPIYFHCVAGADRTGTVAAILEALCGVSEADMSVDYELTSFSAFGARPRYDNGTYLYGTMMTKLKSYPGDTLQEKAEYCAFHVLGLTRADVSNIQSILAGNGVVFESDAKALVGIETDIILKNINEHTISAVTVNDIPTEFSVSGNTLSVKASTAGVGVITFEDGNTITFEAEAPRITVSVKDNTANVSANLDKAYSGIAMVALYSESNQLIGCSQSTLSEESEITAEVTISETPHTAKVFVWNSFDSLKPLTEHITITRGESGWMQ